MGSDSEFGAVGAFVMGIIMLPISACVIGSYVDTLSYDKTLCSGLNLSQLDIDSNGFCSEASVFTCVSDPDGNCTQPIKMVELYYPPTAYPLLVCKETEDTKSWAAGLAAAKSFSCRVDDIYSPGISKGITSLLNGVAGWFIFLVISIIVWIIFIVMMILWCKE